MSTLASDVPETNQHDAPQELAGGPVPMRGREAASTVSNESSREPYSTPATESSAPDEPDYSAPLASPGDIVDALFALERTLEAVQSVLPSFAANCSRLIRSSDAGERQILRDLWRMSTGCSMDALGRELGGVEHAVAQYSHQLEEAKTQGMPVKHVQTDHDEGRTSRADPLGDDERSKGSNNKRGRVDDVTLECSSTSRPLQRTFGAVSDPEQLTEIGSTPQSDGSQRAPRRKVPPGADASQMLFPSLELLFGPHLLSDFHHRAAEFEDLFHPSLSSNSPSLPPASQALSAPDKTSELSASRAVDNKAESMSVPPVQVDESIEAAHKSHRERFENTGAAHTKYSGPNESLELRSEFDGKAFETSSVSKSHFCQPKCKKCLQSEAA